MTNDWSTARLGDVVDIVNGRNQRAVESESGQYPIYGSGGTIGRATSFLCEAGSTVIGRKGSINNPIFVDSRFWNVDTAFGLSPRPGLDCRFLYWFCQHYDFTKHNKGTTLPSLVKTDLLEIRVPFPPLSEQRRIDGILKEAFEGIASAKANAERNPQNAHALFESEMDAAIRGRAASRPPDDTSVVALIDQLEDSRRLAIAQGRTKPRPKTLIEEEVGWPFELPSSWRWTRLESLTIGVSDGVHKTPKYLAEGVPFVTVKNLTAGPGISLDDLRYISRADHEVFIKRTRPEKGDILITKDGTIGVVRRIETDIEFSIFVSVALIKPTMQELGPFLVYALSASCIQSQIVRKGAALKHLYLTDLRRLAIPLPPLSEQKRIVARLDAINTETQRLESIYQRKLVALDELKKSLLHQAFSGQL